MRSPKLRTPEQGNVQGTKPGRTTPWGKQAATPSSPPRAGAPIEGSGKRMPEPGVWGGDVSVSLSAAQEGSGCREASPSPGHEQRWICPCRKTRSQPPPHGPASHSRAATELLIHGGPGQPSGQPQASSTKTLCLVPQVLTEASCGRSLCCAPGLGSTTYRE